MNTPPRSRYQTQQMPPARYAHAPRRPQFEHLASPPRLRSFEEIDGLYPKELEVDEAKTLEARRERERYEVIRKCVAQMDEEIWLFRGMLGYTAKLPHL